MVSQNQGEQEVYNGDFLLSKVDQESHNLDHNPFHELTSDECVSYLDGALHDPNIPGWAKNALKIQLEKTNRNAHVLASQNGLV